jgi:hypothetical protein
MLRILKNVDVIITDDERLFVTGCVPDDEDEYHNCDMMECDAVQHILVQGTARVIGVSVFDVVKD